MTIRPAQHPRLRRASGAAVLAVAALLIAALAAPLTVGAEAPLAGPGTIYFPATGHNVSGDFLEFWHQNGGADRIGNPITEEIQDGPLARQYFERGLIEYTPAVGLSYGRLGAEAVRGRHDVAFMPTTRDEFGTDRDGRQFFAATGHGITGLFGTYWAANGGLGVFGYPLSEPTREAVGEQKAVTTVQYFERARFELATEADGTTNVRLADLGRQFALARNLAINPAPKLSAAQDFAANIWPKWIDVNLTTQHLVAYEGNAVVQQFDITSGEPANPTPTGVFAIFSKLKSERMRGPGYDIPNVPWTMYFAGGGYAIHGAPWRSVYGPGTELGGSHGCVNSPVAQVATLYQWASLGTTVTIHF